MAAWWPPPSDTDWAAVDALSDEEVEARALADPDASPLADDQLARLHRVPWVRLLRRRLGVTQAAFAAAFGSSLGTVRDWSRVASVPTSQRGLSYG